MDWPLYCVIDNKDDKDITEDILCIRKDASSSRYSIIFTNNPTEFHFSLDRITFLDKPNMLDISDKLVFIKGHVFNTKRVSDGFMYLFNFFEMIAVLVSMKFII